MAGLRRMKGRPLAPAVAFLALVIGCNDTGDAKSTSAPLGDCTPSGDEVCDGVDNNCDGTIDEGVETVFFADADGDGFGGSTSVAACERPDGFVDDSTDCDDLNPDAHPGGEEVCDDADNDCDGATDMDDPDVDLSTAGVFYIDEDGDGYGVEGATLEACSTPDGYADNADDCDDTDALLNPDSVWYADVDDDGYGDDDSSTVGCEGPVDHVLDGGDCDDADGAVSPDAAERCDGVDNNCDGEVDEDSAVDATTWYRDEDGDGVGVDTETTVACDPPEGFADAVGDCDDAEPANFPGNIERCDGIDNDCDGASDLDASVPGDFATIQDAIDGLGAGDGVCIAGGTHNEALLFGSTSLTLAGQADGSTIIDAGGDRAFDSQNGAGIVIQDVELRDVDGSSGAALRATGGRVSLRDVVVRAASVRASTLEGIFWMADGTLELDRVEVDGISVRSTLGDVSGAIVHAESSTVSIDELVVDDVDIDSEGAFTGLLHVSEGTLSTSGLVLRNSELTARGQFVGGLLFASDSDVAMDHTDAANNTLSSGQLDLSNGYWVRLEGGPGVNAADLRWLAIDNNVLDGADDAWSAIHVNATEQVALSNLRYTRNTVRAADDGYGVVYAYDSDVSITNADISENDWLGFDSLAGFLGYRSYGADLALVNVNIVANASDSPPNATLLTASYANTAGYGVFSMDHSNVHGNTAGARVWLDDDDEGDQSAFVGNISIDPRYTDASSGDFTLQATSPVIDQGDPSLLDADGSISDIGAHGGPGGASWRSAP